MKDKLVQVTYRGRSVWGPPPDGIRRMWNWINQVVGFLCLDTDIYVKRLGADQFYRLVPGVSISIEVLAQLRRFNCRWVLVTNRDTFEQWWVAFETFEALKEECERVEGWPLHYVLAEAHWERLPELQPQLI